MSRRGVDLGQDFPGGSDAEVKAVSAAAKPFRVVSNEGDVLRETSRYDQLAKIYQVPDQFDATSYKEGAFAFEPDGGSILLDREVLCDSLLNSITVGIPSAGDKVFLKDSREVDGVALMWPGSTVHNAGKLVPVIFEHTRNRSQLATEGQRQDYYYKKFNNTQWITRSIRGASKLVFFIQHEGSYYRVNSAAACSMIEGLMTWIVGMTPTPLSPEISEFWGDLKEMESIEIRVRSPQVVDHGYVSAEPVGYCDMGGHEVSHLLRPESACGDGDLKENMRQQGGVISRSRSQPGAMFSGGRRPSAQEFGSKIEGRITPHYRDFAGPRFLQPDPRFCHTPGAGYCSPVAFAPHRYAPMAYANPAMPVPMQMLMHARMQVPTTAPVPMQMAAQMPTPAPLPMQMAMQMPMPAPALQTDRLGYHTPLAPQGRRSAFLSTAAMEGAVSRSGGAVSMRAELPHSTCRFFGATPAGGSENASGSSLFNPGVQ